MLHNTLVTLVGWQPPGEGSIASFALQAVGTFLNFIGAILLAVEFWKKPQQLPAPAAPILDALLEICRALQKGLPDPEVIASIRQKLAVIGMSGAAAARQEELGRHYMTRAGRTGIAILTAGLFLQLLSLLVS